MAERLGGPSLSIARSPAVLGPARAPLGPSFKEFRFSPPSRVTTIERPKIPSTIFQTKPRPEIGSTIFRTKPEISSTIFQTRPNRVEIASRRTQTLDRRAPRFTKLEHLKSRDFRGIRGETKLPFFGKEGMKFAKMRIVEFKSPKTTPRLEIPRSSVMTARIQSHESRVKNIATEFIKRAESPKTIPMVEKIMRAQRIRMTELPRQTVQRLVTVSMRQENGRATRTETMLKRANFSQTKIRTLVEQARKTSTSTATVTEATTQTKVAMKTETQTGVKTEAKKSEISEPAQRQNKDETLRNSIRFARDEKALGKRIGDIQTAIKSAYLKYPKVDGAMIKGLLPVEYQAVRSQIKPKGPDGSYTDLKEELGKINEQDAKSMEKAAIKLAILMPPVAISERPDSKLPKGAVQRVMNGKGERLLNLLINYQIDQAA